MNGLVDSSYFECANRNDKKEVLFSTPPIPKNKKTKVYFFNTDLLFDETTIYCGKFNFSYEDFYEVSVQHSHEFCDLLNGEKIPLDDLFWSLLLDFSFKQTGKMNGL